MWQTHYLFLSERIGYDVQEPAGTSSDSSEESHKVLDLLLLPCAGLPKNSGCQVLFDNAHRHVSLSASSLLMMLLKELLQAFRIETDLSPHKLAASRLKLLADCQPYLCVPCTFICNHKYFSLGSV